MKKNIKKNDGIIISQQVEKIGKEVQKLQKEEKSIKKDFNKKVQHVEKVLKSEIKKDFQEVSQEIQKLHFSKAVSIIDNHQDNSIFQQIEQVLFDRLKSISSESYEDLGTTYYYILRNILNKNVPVKEEKIAEYFYKMTENFKKHEKNLFSKQKRTNTYFKELQIVVFFKIIETYFLNLEQELKKRNFPELASIAYKKRRHCRKTLFLFKKDYFSWFGYYIWGITSHYGENFFRWGITSIIFILFFASIFWITGQLESVPIDKAGNIILSSNINDIQGFVHHPMLHKVNGHWYDYIYFSIVTFTTLGYGDVLPVTIIDKIITVFAVITGYIMLGVFMTLLSKKF